MIAQSCLYVRLGGCLPVSRCNGAARGRRSRSHPVPIDSHPMLRSGSVRVSSATRRQGRAPPDDTFARSRGGAPPPPLGRPRPSLMNCPQIWSSLQSRKYSRSRARGGGAGPGVEGVVHRFNARRVITLWSKNARRHPSRQHHGYSYVKLQRNCEGQCESFTAKLHTTF